MPDRAYGTVLTAPRRAHRASRLGSWAFRWRIPLAVIGSRVLVFGAGAVGSLTPRVRGWTSVDPTHLTLSFGPVGNALTGAAIRWDSIGYLNIAAHGYTQKGETILFGFYPLLISALGAVTGSYVISGLLISWVSFGVALVLLHRLTELELGPRAADATVLLLAFAPLSLFFTAVYTESLFLVLSVGAIYAARRDRLVLAAVLAAMATVTRVTGILLVVPIAIMAIEHKRRFDRRLLWLALSPAALAGFLAYMQQHGYGWLAPIHNQQAHHFGGPIATVVAAARFAVNGVTGTLSGERPLASAVGPFSLPLQSIVLFAVLLIGCAALLIAWRRLPLAYSAYAALALLVCISSQTIIQPLLSVDRYLLTIFPLWMAAGAWLAERGALKPVLLISALLLLFYSASFATWAYIA